MPYRLYLIAAMLLFGAAASAESVIRTTGGAVQGITSGSVTVYKGMRYAAPVEAEVYEGSAQLVRADPRGQARRGDIASVLTARHGPRQWPTRSVDCPLLGTGRDECRTALGNHARS